MAFSCNYLMASPVRTFAPEHYDKFLKGAKVTMSLWGGEEVRRTAMVFCLLVIYIESMQYRYSDALEHAQNCLRMMEVLRSDPSDEK
ncbi:hypothetical protein WAI453_002166 [Rhynchosporium graminicola]